jgi:hypothetical protein
LNVITDFKMSNSYKLANQRILQKTTDMEEDIYYLRLRTFKAPCILITGLEKLHLSKSIKHYENEQPYVNVIHTLFRLLNMPISWILSIDNSSENTKPNCIPSEVLIILITDNVKLFVYRTLKHHFKDVNQKHIVLKSITLV